MSGRRHSHKSPVEQVQRALEALPGRLRRTRKHWQQRWRWGLGSRQLAFVFGCQRSGTKMLMRVLDQAPEVRIYHEHHKAAFARYELRASPVIRTLRALNGAPLLVFKPICDNQRAASILDSFPDARGVWIYRHWADVVHSSVAKWGDHQLQVVQSLASGDTDWLIWQAHRIPPDVLAELRKQARADLTPHEGSALFWWMRNTYYFSQHLDRHPSVHTLRYADLARDPEAVAGALFEHLGIRFDPAYTSQINARSVGSKAEPELRLPIRVLVDELLARMDAHRSAEGAAA